MKLQMTSTNRTIVAMLVVAALAAAFWILLLSPKREQVAELGKQVAELKSSLALHEAEAAEAEEARRQFPAQYRRLVVLGKAVPGDDDVASLLVQLTGVAGKAGGTFRDISLSSEGGGGEAAAPAAAPGGTPASATEAAASLLPLGATIGPAGLGVMPYTISFDGSFFEIADFIKELDALVKTGRDEVTVKGRLVTIDSFSLSAEADGGFPNLQASFSVTTFLTPPGQGVGGDALPATPGASTATPAATTLGGTP
jgi:Tfp pilus assembly protein PilO